eukprot:6989076-Pyramimonas_sp.AAC.1
MERLGYTAVKLYSHETQATRSGAMEPNDNKPAALPLHGYTLRSYGAMGLTIDIQSYKASRKAIELQKYSAIVL